MLEYKSSFAGYFRFFYRVVGNRLLVSVLLSIIVSILDGVGLTMLMPLLQSVADGSEASTESMGHLHYITDMITGLGFSLTLGTVLSVVGIVFLLKGFVKFLELSYQAKVLQYFMKKVRHELVDGLEKISFSGFTQLDAGNIQNNLIAEVQRTSNAAKNYLAYSQALFMLIIYIIFATAANYQFAVLVAISVGVTNILYSRFYKKMKEASYEISSRGDNFNAFLIQAIHYFKYLKSTNYLSNYSKKLGNVIDKTEHLNRKTATYTAITTGMREPMILLIVITVIYVQINFMGGNLASIILSLVLFYRALNFLLASQQNWQSFIQNTGSLRNISTIYSMMKNREEANGTVEFNTLQHEILLQNVSMAYGVNNVVDQVNIRIPRSETIALVGESGSGKTTLVNILMGLIQPDSGTVLIDNTPLTKFKLETYRSKLGYISQDSVIFNDTIFNNITFWAEPTPEVYERFWEVISMASLKEFVESKPDKELTKLGDNGILISGGQKQRISIAREMFKKVEILVLDEATSALDSETELFIQENIEKLHGQFTIVVIAHRLSTIKNVDNIFLLENGRVVTSGDFDSMVKKSEKFKRMVSLQGLSL
jgi:ABC-type multidrug transport system fused ATPase/permease subunit